MRTGKYIVDMHKSTEETQSIKRMMRFVVMMLLMMCFGVGEVWADDITICVEKSDGSFATITGTSGSVNEGITGGKVSVAISDRNVTLTVTPDANYRINKDLILVEKMVNPTNKSNAPRRAPGLGTFPFSGGPAGGGWITNNSDNTDKTFTFTVTSDYDGAYVVTTFVPISSPATQITSLDQITDLTSGNYELAADIDASSYTSLGEFKGTLDGKFFTIHHLEHPLFASTDGATIRNINFENVNISTGDANGDAGAITSCAKGATRIYNCGILPTTTEYDADGNVTGFLGSSVGGGGNVGGLVGKLEGNARAINCFSYANITSGTTVAGIVGNIGNTAITQNNLTTVPMVVNCMFYGDITGGTTKYPVYGGSMIKNDANNGVNPYCYFRKTATFDNSYSSINDYNRSWPAEDKNLTRFEYYRSVLNSNRRLCTWWVGNTTGTAPTDDDVKTVGIAKWVLDETIAPYPILKKWGKYPSIINIDPDDRINPETKVKESRSLANEWEGKSYNTLKVVINAGSHNSSAEDVEKNITITDMDTLNHDYGYYKIQLPYYNDIFGNPNGTSHAAKYGNNYTDYVVTGWKITAVNDDDGEGYTFNTNAETGYNFTDRNDKYKDLYAKSGRVFAQGGYYYIPEGVTSINIEAYWGKAVYLTNRGYSIDRVKVTAGDYRKADKSEAKNFDPAGTVSNTFQTNYTVYDDLQTAISALGSSSDYPTVYDQAIVLIGNHQVKNGSESVAGSANNWHPFSIMSADFDFDNEPDYCLELQFRSGVDRPGIQPIRFDFLSVIELGLAVRHDKLAYAIGLMVPQGHFEITETALMRTTQFEWDANVTKFQDPAPIILNGGEFEQLAVRYAAGTRTSYFLLGGHLWFHRFAPGAHPHPNNTTNIGNPRLCPVSVIGGDFPEFYLSGLYKPERTPAANQGNPYCYINGGHFGTIHGAGYDKIDGNVTFKINHAAIGEFYGGGINGSNPIGGVIDVTIDNSRVDKYCGGPEVGDMTGKTVTTHATGTTFGVFYGGGNGGNSYYRQLQLDGDQNSSRIGTWGSNSGYNWDSFNPLVTYDDDTDAENKGYHAEYEFEVFNQSNGVADEITQRGFIKWVQFGITITGNVTNTLTGCTVENSFYGGGNLATVDGTVTSTLTNTTVNGSVFGAGYSAAIPTFQVQDKNSRVFPSMDFAGTITDGYIPYTTTVYEWTNEIAADAEGATEDAKKEWMKQHPTYQGIDGQWYCYTWNSLANLGAVTGNATLSIEGTTTVGGSVYGGGEESNVSGNTEISMSGGTVSGNVFGGGQGSDDNYECDKAMVGVNNAGAGADPAAADNKEKGTKVIITDGTVNGSVYGGGEVGRVEWNTQVTIGTAGDTNESARPVISGSVFGAGAGVETHGYSALVRGNSTVTVQGKAKVLQNVYGGGENATVGRYWVKGINNKDAQNNVIEAAKPVPDDLPDGMPYKQQSGGICTVTIQDNAQIGPDNGGTETAGHVFGAGKGVLPQFNAETSKKMVKGDAENPDRLVTFTADANHATAEDAYLEFLQTLALVTNTDVTIDGSARIKGSVYGGSESGYVQHDTKVTVSGGTIGTPKNGNNVYGGAFYGNVYGGGKGDAELTGTNENYLVAGIVKGSTEVKIEDGTILHNIYGGGAYGTVGVFDYNATTGLPTSLKTTAPENSGKTKIEITGGEIGTDGKENGMVFGSSRGDVGAPGSIHDKLAWVYDTKVYIGTEDNPTELTTPLIRGSVYGGGENGHNFNDAEVYIYSGTIGMTSGGTITDDNGTPDDDEDDIEYSGAAYPYRGNVYGGGCGTDMYWIDTDNDNKVDEGEEHFNSLAGIVYGDASITMSGGQVVHNIYGAGAMGSVGKAVTTNNVTTVTGGETTITISGGKIGVDGTYGEGNVYGAARGSDNAVGDGLALVRKSSSVSISGTGTQIKGNVYGGGELGCVGVFTETEDGRYVWTTGTGGSNVAITGGSITGNVFGAGKGKDDTFKCEKGMVKEANVSITAGTVGGDVYGGGEVGRVEYDTEVKIGDGAGTANGTPAPTIGRSVFGGGAGVETHGYSALVRGNTTVTVEGNAKIEEGVYGGGEIASVGRYGLDAAKMPSILLAGGKCTVNVQGYATIGTDVFGAGKGVDPHFDKTNTDKTKRSRRMTLYTNTTDFPVNDNGTTWEPVTAGATLTPGSTLVWDYFQDEDAYSTYLETLALATAPVVTIGGNAAISGSVFGGGEVGLTKGSVVVNILGGTIAEDVYGGGALANTNTTSSVGVLNNEGAPVKENGNIVTTTVHPTTKVNLLGGTIGGNAYGGGLGRLAHEAVPAVYTAVESGTTLTVGNTYYTSDAGTGGFEATGNENTSTTTYYELTTPASEAVEAVEAFVYGDIKVNLNGLEADDYTESIHSNYVHAVGSPATEYALKTTTSGEGANAVTTYPKGAIVNQIFGCNNLNGSPKKHVRVHVFATQNADASHNRLNLKYPKRPVQGENDTENSKETSKQYLQRLINATHVDGDTNKDLLPGITGNVINAAQTTCNNNSATDEQLNTAIANVQQELCKLYDMKAVYGGGNLAAYVPADPTPTTPLNDTKEYTEVIIDGCDLTSIETVYGGGNAASVPASKVRVNGTYEIEELFGGGNGKDLNTINGEVYQNPGANVGYYNYTHYVKKNETDYNATNDGAGTSVSPYIVHDNTDASTVDDRKAHYKYGDGITTIEVTGGTVHAAYGGSNTKGNIREKTESTYEDAEICPMQIDESYGGGKNSPMDAEVAVNLDCVKNMDMIFGGSKNADVNNNITLNITNGTFQKVFGGNNTSGAINGAITVNIEEKGCQPIRIDELYLGGYLAPYSVYGYNDDKSPKTSGTRLYNDPRLNVISATYIGDIFGGGYQAKMVGNPYVNVNMTEGKIEVTKVEVTKTEVSKKAVTKRAKETTDNTELTITEGETTYVYVNSTTFYDPAKVETISGESPTYYVYYTTEETVETVYDPARVEKGNTNYIYKDAASRYYDPAKVVTESTKYYVYTDIHNDPHTPITGDESMGTLEIGTIGNIYGGGNEADVIGDTHVEIGTGRWVKEWYEDEDHLCPIYETEYIDTQNNTVKNLYYKVKENKHEVYYTKAECNEYNATLPGFIGSGITLDADQAALVNKALNLPDDNGFKFEEGDQLEDVTNGYPYHYAYNATLAGARKTTDIRTHAEWAWYTYDNGTYTLSDITPTPTRKAAKITGNVFGGGKGVADNFYCNKAMVGVDGAGAIDADGDGNKDTEGGTYVTINNGTIDGNVYGGGEIGRVENNTMVTIGEGAGVDPTSTDPLITSEPEIKGSVYGGGAGVDTHGYSALVRGNPTVIVQGNAKVRGNVYGGGEIASVARYKVKLDPADPDAPVGWPMNMPYALKNANSGFCTVTIGGYAEIGPEAAMHMETESGMPDDAGHVFGAGQGILPKVYTYADDDNKPKRMVLNDDKTASIWEHFANENTYIGFIQTLALASQTEVTIKDHAFVKGSVYGGAFNGIVQYNTHVTIDGDCQIGAGKDVNRRYTTDEWAYDGSTTDKSLPECASWPYGKTVDDKKFYLPFDIYDLDGNKPKAASDGHTFYGNVFGGGSGYYPYRRKSAALDGAAWTKNQAKTDEIGQPVDIKGFSDGVWLSFAGIVRGNTTVDILGGHILTSVYGGNEQTDVVGSCTVNMSGGTLGVPRTLAQIAAHPVTCYLFGAGKGDQRINFNTWTNVASANVNITGGRIYGSVFGGGEDGHVLGDVTMNIGQAQGKTTKIGTWGTSYVDGNVFGGGRGFSGEAQTAGTVGGNVTMNITGGEMLGSIYGGGRLASVGTQFTSPEDDNYGNFVEDNEDIKYTQAECDEYNATLFGYIPAGTALTAAQTETVNAALGTNYAENGQITETDAAEYNEKLYGYKTTNDIRIPAGTYGHITIDISGGTIGNDLESISPTKNNIPSSITEEDIDKWGDDEWAAWKEENNITGDIPDGMSPTKGNIPSSITKEDIDEWGNEDWAAWKEQNHIPNTEFDRTTKMAIHTKGGNVFGGSMGRLQLLNGKTNPIWPKMAQVKTTNVNIYGTAVIKRSVYGGGELGTVRDNVYVTIGGIKKADVNSSGVVDIEKKGGGTVNWDVFGGGYGSDDDDIKTVFTVKELTENAGDPPYSASDYEEHTYAFTPMQFAGCVGQNTFVHICGGYVKKSVYGGGEMASVGIINCRVDATAGENKIEAGTKDNTTYYYSNMVKHTSSKDDGAVYDFGLSWPYEFEYVPTFNGATHVHVTGGRIGATKADDIGTDNGDIYGGGKGIAGDYNDYVFCANVGSAEVRIKYDNTNALTLDPKTYMEGGDCITGAVYGGGENGHVMGDTKLTLENGLIGHSMYGGGSGKGQFSQKLLKIGKTSGSEDPNDYYTRDIYSITAGKVFGNTELEMTGGYVVRNVYGGGNMGSVGKGNYSGGSDDYSAAGYGELPPKDNQNLWTTNTIGDFPWHFLNSGKCKVTITGGTIGYINENDPSSSMYPWNSTASLPYGNVFGGCRGVSAPNIGESPRYLYCPESFMGFVNETEVTIGTKNDATAGPRIYGSVYGGGQDGHVRRDASVTVNSGEIGLAYNEENRQMLKTLISNSTEPHIATSVEDLSDLDNLQWLARGNVYGAGSGIGNYNYDFNYDGDYLDKVDYTNPQTGRSSTVKETDFSTSAGSVTRFTTVTINGGKIHRNVYGGGSLSSVGAPKIPPIPNDPYRKGDTNTEHGEGKQSLNQVNIAGTIGTPEDYQAHYGGEVYGASRGIDDLNDSFSNTVWTEVNLKKGAHVQGNVFGGGDSGPVREDSEVNVGVTFSITSTDVENNAISYTQAGSSKTINVTSNITWEAKSSASWLTISPVSGKGDGTITVTATANSSEGATARTATITISGAGETKTITVTQEGNQ